MLVPLKAVVMNMLSIASAFGVAVMIFQWGWGSAIFGVEAAPIEPFVPMMLFAIVFGLSMDYEVFLLSRVKEPSMTTPATQSARWPTVSLRPPGHHRSGGDHGRGRSAASCSRTTASSSCGRCRSRRRRAARRHARPHAARPATMRLLGAENWWLPSWLDKILPSLNVEGPVDAHEHHPGDDDDDGTHGPADREPALV
ncbi:MAG: MMPL family transporter [Acidimicrobiales bacterium]